MPLDILRRQEILYSWFAKKNWHIFPFQKAAWEAFLAGKSGCIHVATGSGKTLAAFGGPILEIWDEPNDGTFRIIYISPIRSLAQDLAGNLQTFITELGLNLTVGVRSGDTTAYKKQQIAKKPPQILVTTPESLALLCSTKDVFDKMQNLSAVIVDEWHELIGNKRGSLLELTLARLSLSQRKLRIWGVSATVKNIHQAAEVLTASLKMRPTIITGTTQREIEHEVLEPSEITPFPWAGHLGLTMLDPVLQKISIAESTLIFTNTRYQAERWFQGISSARPEWQDKIALHHGSVHQERREEIENGLRIGALKVVVATSSLDLGVDFGPVEHVFQIGSIKMLGRLLQRAGRSRHRPDAASAITFVPTHALELFDFEAAKRALARGELEARRPLFKPLDVMVQHLLNWALAGGFSDSEAKACIRSTYSFTEISDDEWDWALQFITIGGKSLAAYDSFQKVFFDGEKYVFNNPRLARIQRMNIGTILASSAVPVQFLGGKSLGTVDEQFIAKLKPGEIFSFAGRSLELVKFWQDKVLVKIAKKNSVLAPQWAGTSLPISLDLGDAIRNLMFDIQEGRGTGLSPSLKKLIELQLRYSTFPSRGEILAERLESREGSHVFIYPFAGHILNQIFGLVWSYRLTLQKPQTFAITANDYGLELFSSEPLDWQKQLNKEIMTEKGFLEDLKNAINTSELAKRHFREISRISGLVPQSFPGKRKTGSQVMISSSLLFEVFKNHEPDHKLYLQSYREAYGHQFQEDDLRIVAKRIESETLNWVNCKRPSPFAFPLLVERTASRITSESLHDRVEKMIKAWEQMRV